MGALSGSQSLPAFYIFVGSFAPLQGVVHIYFLRRETPVIGERGGLELRLLPEHLNKEFDDF